MPCATVHLVLADRVLERWRETPRRAPFSPSSPEAVRAFMHGALAPDMGYVPGTDRLVSDLVHYLRPADFTRRLLEIARTEEEEAFAWGWATHVLADVEIHPLVGRAAGERLFGDRSRRIDAMVNVAAHVSLEVGLDMALVRTSDGVPRPPDRAFFRDVPGIRPLAEALGETYGFEWDPGGLMRHHRRAVELTRWWPRALTFLPLRPPGPPVAPDPSDPRESSAPSAPGSRPSARPPWKLVRPGDRGVIRRSVVHLLRRMVGEGSAARGFFTPEAPRRWFFLEVMQRAGSFVDAFQAVVDDGLAGMANLNLETGGRAGTGRGHPATEVAARELALRRTAAQES
jgi:hypothetical protein